MNHQVDKIQTWLLANKLSVHYVDKSQYMLINANNTVRVDDGCFELKMANFSISRTKTYNYLGIIVDEKFCWVDHINEVCIKLSQAAGVIFKIRTLLSKEALMLKGYLKIIIITKSSETKSTECAEMLSKKS